MEQNCKCCERNKNYDESNTYPRESTTTCPKKELPAEKEPQLIKEHCLFCGHNVKIGRIAGAFFLKEQIGEGSVKDKKGTIKEFTLAISCGARVPVVVFGKQNFILSWEEIIKLAEDAGLFREERAEKQEAAV